MNNMTQNNILRRLNPSGDLQSLIDTYYEARGLRTPDAKEALFWLISELGELTEAWLVNDKTVTNGCREILVAMVMLGKRADIAVSNMQGDWLRNFQPAGTIDINGEAADVLMMLDRFCKAADLPTPEECFMTKADRKIRKNLS